VLWSKGYGGTSVADLVQASGVNKFGLYAEFRDKHGLFVETLRYYTLIDAAPHDVVVRTIVTDHEKRLELREQRLRTSAADGDIWALPISPFQRSKSTTARTFSFCCNNAIGNPLR